ncbi:MAG TPA: hypothetical protein VFF66_06700 [Brevundimonas sp.]|nr:hypothetical protein [Brevundimonas sp.]
MAIGKNGVWTAGMLALGLSWTAGPAMAQDGMPSFASDAALRTFLTTRPPPVTSLREPPPPPPPAPISHHARPVPGLPPAPRPSGPIQHDPPRLSWSDRVAPVPGVDAGDMARAVGDHLVILRRGRLFSISTAGDELRVVQSVDAFAPGAMALRDWTRQMFVVGDTVAVVAFSAARGGTEVSRFRVSPAGALSWIDTHQLHRGGSYDPAEARVVDGQLIFYVSSDPALEGGGDPLEALPTVGRWSPDRARMAGERMVDAGEVFVPAPLMATGAGGRLSQVSVTRCDLAAEVFACDATVTLAPWTRQFHVARDAVYVWTGTSGDEGPSDPGYLFRIPHDGGRPGAVRVWGHPPRDSALGLTSGGDRLHVLVQPLTPGDAAFAREFADGDSALLRLPLARFGDGSRTAPLADYQFLPLDSDDFIRFAQVIEGNLLYVYNPDDADGTQRVRLVTAPAEPDAPTVFDMENGVYRLAPAGRDAVVTGAGAGLPFNIVDLEAGSDPALGPTLLQAGVAEYETRHGDFYHADPDAPDEERGLLVLPVGRTLEPLDLLFLRRDGDRLTEAGRLVAPRGVLPDDGCLASCAAWHRDSRPIFVGERIFALLAYDLVEGELTADGRLREIRRLDFAPPGPSAQAE